MKKRLKWAMLAISCGLLMASQQANNEPAPPNKPVPALEQSGLSASQVITGSTTFNVGGYAVVPDAQDLSIFRVNAAGNNVATVRAYSAPANVLTVDAPMAPGGKLAIDEDEAVKVGKGVASRMSWTNPHVVLRGTDYKTTDGTSLARYKTPGREGYLYYYDFDHPGYLVDTKGGVFAAQGVKLDPKVVARLREAHAGLGADWQLRELSPGKPVALVEGRPVWSNLVLMQDPNTPTKFMVSDPATGVNLAQFSALADKAGDRTKVLAWRADAAPDSHISDADLSWMGSYVDQQVGIPPSDVLVKSSKPGAAKVTYRRVSDGQPFNFDQSTGELRGGKDVYVTASGLPSPKQVALASHGAEYTFTEDPHKSAIVWALGAGNVPLASLTRYDGPQGVALVGEAARDSLGRVAVDAKGVVAIGHAYANQAGLNNVAILQAGRSYTAADGSLYPTYQDDVGSAYIGTSDNQALVNPSNEVYVRNGLGAVDPTKVKALKQASLEYNQRVRATGKPVAALEKYVLPAFQVNNFRVGDFQVNQIDPSTFNVTNAAGDRVMNVKAFGGPNNNVLAADVALTPNGKLAVAEDNAVKIGTGIAHKMNLTNAHVVLRGTDYKTTDGGLLARYGTLGEGKYRYYTDSVNPDYLVDKDGTVHAAQGMKLDPKVVETLQKEHAFLKADWSSLESAGKPVALAERRTYPWEVTADPNTPANLGVSDAATGVTVASVTALADKNGDGTVTAWAVDTAPDRPLSTADFSRIGIYLDQQYARPTSDVLVKDGPPGAAKTTYRRLSDGQLYSWDPSTGEFRGDKEAYVTAKGLPSPKQVALASHAAEYTFTTDPKYPATVWASAPDGTPLAKLTWYDGLGAAAGEEVHLVGEAAKDSQGRAAVNEDEIAAIGHAFANKVRLKKFAILQARKDYAAGDGSLYHAYQDEAGNYYLGTPDQTTLVDPLNGVWAQKGISEVDPAKAAALKKARVEFGQAAGIKKF